MSVSTADIVAFLAGATLGRGCPVEVIETHLSWVFRYRDDVLKIKKPVQFLGQDLRALGARRSNCEAELALNRRFAPHVYRDLVAVCVSAQGLQLGGRGKSVEWAVRMRRLPDAGFLHRRIAAGTVDRATLGRALAPLIRHHLTAASAVTSSAAAYMADLELALDEAAVGLTAFAPAVQVIAAVRGWLRANHPLIADRVAAGRVVDGHGDLRPEHVCLVTSETEDLPPALIDCLEFDDLLRRVDGLDELGYLALECELLGSPSVAEAVVETWNVVAEDDAPPALLWFYQARRALRRASVTAHRLAAALDRPERGDPERLRLRVAGYLAAASRRAGWLFAWRPSSERFIGAASRAG